MSEDTPWTPGPWFARGTEVCAVGSVTQVSAVLPFDWRLENATALADSNYMFRSNGELVPDEERTANAYLMAAAPELYDCLNAFCMLAELCDPSIKKLADRSYSVLAKARGTSPE